MPGLVIASRRWIIGSDDFVIPGLILLVSHLIWLIIYGIVCLQSGSFFQGDCSTALTYHVFGQAIQILGCSVIEFCIIKTSFRGSILDTNARRSLNHLLFIRLALFAVEVCWEAYGFVIIFDYNLICSLYTKEVIITLKVFNFFIWLSLLCIIWCSFDPAGKSWVKMKKFQDSLKDKNPKYKYRRSKGSSRNWRHREALRKYEKTWDNRCRKFCCLFCVRNPKKNSFAEIAKLLSEFFRDLDVVPSDVIAGLSLMRVQQKAKRCDSVKNSKEKVFQFLSGVAITSETNFLDLTHPVVVNEVLNLIHYLHYSLAIYGWPMYMVSNSPTQWCKLLNHMKCCAGTHCFACDSETRLEPNTVVHCDGNVGALGDNCCLCNRAAIRQTCIEHNYHITYITYEVAVEKPPFFVAVDYDKMSIVVSIRGTLSLYDVLTDLNAEHEILPLNVPNENWFGHKGMVSAANYIRSELAKRSLLERANEELKARDEVAVSQYPIVIVGHSLGAGTAAILTILLRQTYNNVICFAFAPPGGLLSESAAEYSKDFVISIVLAKDIVPRLGLHQMEKLRFDLIHAIKQCNMTKWSLIFKSCCLGEKELSVEDFVKQFNMQTNNGELNETAQIDEFKKLSIHPNDESISLTVHTPLYPPGSIIHLVRVHPNKAEQLLNSKHPIIQSVWADFKDFNEILISPTMIKDHMPDRILEALEDLLSTTGPPKPQRTVEHNLVHPDQSSSSPSNESEPTKVLVETSFTDSFKVLDQREAWRDQNRLHRLKSLVRKGRAPLATPEEISLSSNADVSEIISMTPCELSGRDEYSSTISNQDAPPRLSHISSDSMLEKK